MTKRKPRDRTNARRQSDLVDRYTAAGLVQIKVWVPPDAAPGILARCQQLRDIHLGRARECERCGFVGKFIDRGETCPKCLLVQ